jgi:hypothetical protein
MLLMGCVSLREKVEFDKTMRLLNIPDGPPLIDQTIENL